MHTKDKTMKTPTQPKTKSAAKPHAEKVTKGAGSRTPKKPSSVKKKPSAWSNLISSTPSHLWSNEDKKPNQDPSSN
jgi:hypothetical protein